MTPDANRYERAADAWRTQDNSGWRFAVLAANTGGTYQALAEYIGGVSVDSVESKAHAWEMYRGLRREYGAIIGHIRRMPYIYLSHFLALHRIRRKYGVGLDACYSYLCDVLQGEGSISSRDLLAQAEREHGTERTRQYEADAVRRPLGRLLSRLDLVAGDRELLAKAHRLLGELALS